MIEDVELKEKLFQLVLFVLRLESFVCVLWFWIIWEVFGYDRIVWNYDFTLHFSIFIKNMYTFVPMTNRIIS